MKSLIAAAFAVCLPLVVPTSAMAMQAELVAPEISIEAMREDLRELASNIKANHPRPFRIITEEDFDALIASKVASLDENATRSDLMWAMSEILASIGCAHSRMSFFNQEERLIEVSARFPVDVRMHGGRLYVMDPLSNFEHVSKGEEIVSINGISVPQLTQEIFTHISSDADLPNIKGPSFNIYATGYLTYALDFPSTYQVRLRGGAEPITLNPLEDFENRPVISPLADCQDRLCYHVDEERNIGIMTIRSFDYYGADGQQFADFTTSVFDDLGSEGRSGLLIDTRGILGGAGYVGSYLLRHLTDKPFDYYDALASDPRGDASLFVPQLPIATQFDGPAFILMDGMTVSALPHFYALAKHNGIATLIGEPAGGGKSTTDGKVQLTASNSGIEYTVARMRFDVAAPSLSIEEAVRPDILVPYSLEDILDRTDIMRANALDLLAVQATKDTSAS